MTMEALEPRVLLYLECYPSQTGRRDYKQSIVKVLLVDKRTVYTRSVHHLKAISMLSGSSKPTMQHTTR